MRATPTRPRSPSAPTGGTISPARRSRSPTAVRKNRPNGRRAESRRRKTSPPLRPPPSNGKRPRRMIRDDGQSPLEMTPTTEVAAAPANFRTWLLGNWDGSGGGYHLTISSDLNWQYTSSVGGSWYASGTARIEGPATVVLEGWFKGGYSPERLTMVLHRRGESLAGEFRLLKTWLVTFSRSSRPGTK